MKTAPTIATLATLAALMLPTTASAAEPACEGLECWKRGVVLRDGDPKAKVEPDVKAAAAHFQKACGAKVHQGCQDLAQLRLEGRGVAKDPAKATQLLVKTCELGGFEGCYWAGRMYAGMGPKKDLPRAKRFLSQACDKKVAPACTWFGLLSRDAKEFDESGMAFTKACELGDGDGCLELGMRFHTGRSGHKDMARALAAFGKACDVGQLQGCVNAAVTYEDGDGVPKDTKKAEALLTRACEGGMLVGCHQIAIYRLEGTNGPADRAKALASFEALCKKGLKMSCNAVKTLHKAAAKPPEGPRETSGTLTKRRGKKLVLKVSDGAPPKGAKGELSKFVKQGPFSAWLVIARVEVKAVAGAKVTCRILEEKSKTVVNGKKVDHFKKGSQVKLKW